jgi:NAD(P)H-dependent FMN reductase
MARPKIAIIIGSTRDGRFGDKPANWIHEVGKQRSDLDFELVDLRDYPMPFFNEPASPLWVPSKNEVAQKWQKKLDEFDGFIFIAAEYNRGPTGVLTNAFDYAYPSWNKKPAAFVGYGGVGGARAIEQLRLQAIELQMTPIRVGVHIFWQVMQEAMGGKNLKEFDFLQANAKDMLDQLAWYAKALKVARDADAAQAKAA